MFKTSGKGNSMFQVLSNLCPIQELPLLMHNPKARGLVIICSLVDLIGSRTLVYEASKNALQDLIRSAARHYEKFSIFINLPLSGLTQSLMIENWSTEKSNYVASETLLRKLCMLQEIAKLFFFIISHASIGCTRCLLKLSFWQAAATWSLFTAQIFRKNDDEPTRTLAFEMLAELLICTDCPLEAVEAIERATSLDLPYIKQITKRIIALGCAIGPQYKHISLQNHFIDSFYSRTVPNSSG